MIPIETVVPQKVSLPFPVIVILNGPMDSGKDVIGQEIKKLIGVDCQLFAFKNELFRYTRDTFKITQLQIDQWQLKGSDDPDKWEKHLPRAELGGRSMRQALIYVSEELVKPLYGKDFFGCELGVRIKGQWPRPKLAVVTDGGFNEEFRGLVDRTRGCYDVLVVKLKRDGCAYASNDSRNYVNTLLIQQLNQHEMILENSGTLREAALKIIKTAERISNGYRSPK